MITKRSNICMLHLYTRIKYKIMIIYIKYKTAGEVLKSNYEKEKWTLDFNCASNE